MALLHLSLAELEDPRAAPGERSASTLLPVDAIVGAWLAA
jgi:hypothetical protein